ncbi:MAG: ATP-binding cassette domain-containing protein, partial [Clostridia bacterium]|nr:ATP-binding cassette domain-containing protein [Clostridia bacterium]
PKPTFEFPFRPAKGKTALWVNDLAIGYDEQLLPEINLMLATGSKLAVTGFNGIGKTTFLKTVCGRIPPLSGNSKLAEDTVVGFFEQEHVWPDGSLTPLQILKDRFPRMTDKELRTCLSRCGLTARQVMQGVASLSGGEQAKVKLCALTLRPCSLLVLDEPTNHLDVNAVAQLEKAIKSFAGSVIFVSHSKDFCAEAADTVLDLEALFD